MRHLKYSIFFFLLLVNNSLFAQKNVILVIADDLSPDYLGFIPGYKDTVPLPTLRKLANAGIIFTNMHSNPVCSSTRAGILTGRYSFRNGVGAIVGGTGGSGVIDTSEWSLPKALKAYNPTIKKANIGKWHLTNPTPMSNLQVPNYMGYDHFEGPFIGQLPSYYQWSKITNGTATTVTQYATTENIENALTWIQTNKQNQFFLWLAFNAPHSPYHLPPSNLHTYAGLSGTTQHIQQNQKLYFKASLQALDTELGRMLDSLNRWGLRDSTTIIFIGDNGNTTQTAQIANTTRSKGTIYDYGIKVPCIVQQAGKNTNGQYNNALINTVDLYATILESMGYKDWQRDAPTDKPKDSKSIVPLLEGTAIKTRDWVFSEIFKNITDNDDGKCIKNTKYKLLRFNNGKEEFYQWINDPEETSNLLLRSLNEEELIAYKYLCQQFNTLLSSNQYCTTSVTTKENLVQKLNIYPNPTNQYLSIDRDNERESTFEIRHITGKQIMKVKAGETLDLSNLQPGTYIVSDPNNFRKKGIFIKI